MPLDINRIEALCFDVDGTLTDTDDQFVMRLSRWLAPARFLFKNHDPHPFARQVVMATESPGTFLFSIPDRMGLDGPLSRAGDWIYQKGLGRSNQSFVLIPGIREMLDQISQHYPLAIVSARGQRAVERIFEQHGLDQYFCSVVTAQSAKHTKPYPDPVLRAASEIGVSPEACLMIGDTTVDITAGKLAGAQTVGVLCGFGEREELVRCGADMILPAPTHLPGVLLNVNSG